MSTKPRIWVAMRYSGEAISFPPHQTIWQVLDSLYNEYTSAGSNWSRPTKLFLNGELLDFGGYDVMEVAINHAEESRRLCAGAVKAAKAKAQTRCMQTVPPEVL
jgi:hypothetical protein